MIDVWIDRDPDGQVIGFDVTGHADTAPAGEDIVCAGVSGIVQMALLGIEKIAGCAAPEKVIEGHVRWRGKLNEVGEAIVKTMILALEVTARDYPRSIKVFSSAKGRPSLRPTVRPRR